jgi:uncharacterized delta-60 repeat protein
VGYGVSVDATGNIVATGTINGNPGDLAVWRWTASGAPDTSFGAGTGVAIVNVSGTDFGQRVSFDASGRIIVVGGSGGPNTGYDMTVWRLNPDSSLNTTFGNGGYVTHDNAAGGNAQDLGYGIALDPDGKIVVSGISWNGAWYEPVLWRINP